MNPLKSLPLFLILFFTQSAFAQSSEIDSLICKSWKFVSYEAEGEKIMARPDQKNDRMIFYFDHQVKSIEGKKIENGIWTYDSAKKTLTIIDNQTKVKAIMKVLKLTKTQCILEYKDPNGIVLKIHMAPVNK
jgi:hypothetical protein